MAAKRPRHVGYMDKERAESEERRKEYLGWLKRAQAESKGRRKAFVASTRAYSKTIGREPGDPIYDKYMKIYRGLRYKDGFEKHDELPLNKKTQG